MFPQTADRPARPSTRPDLFIPLPRVLRAPNVEREAVSVRSAAALPSEAMALLGRMTPDRTRLLLTADPLMIRNVSFHAAPLYRLLRRRSRLELILLAVAAALLTYPLRSELLVAGVRTADAARRDCAVATRAGLALSYCSCTSPLMWSRAISTRRRRSRSSGCGSGWCSGPRRSGLTLIASRPRSCDHRAASTDSRWQGSRRRLERGRHDDAAIERFEGSAFHRGQRCEPCDRRRGTLDGSSAAGRRVAWLWVAVPRYRGVPVDVRAPGPAPRRQRSRAAGCSQRWGTRRACRR